MAFSNSLCNEIVIERLSLFHLSFAWTVSCLGIASLIFQTSHHRAWISRFCGCNQFVCRNFTGLREASKIVKICSYFGPRPNIPNPTAFRKIARDFMTPVWNRIVLFDHSLIIPAFNGRGDCSHWGCIRLKASPPMRNDIRIGGYSNSKKHNQEST